MAIVFIPPLLRNLTRGADKVTVAGKSLRQVVNNLDLLYPGFKDHVVDGERLIPGLSAAIDGDFSRLGLMEPVQENSEIHFLPAISGG